MKKILFILLVAILCGCNKKEDALVKKYNRVFFFGDSNTELGFGKYTAYSLGAEYLQCAKGGTESKDYLCMDSINKMVAFNPDLIVVRLGTNDVGNNHGKYDAQGYISLIKLIKNNSKCRIVLVGLCNMPVMDLDQEIMSFNLLIKSQGQYVDLYNNADYSYMYPVGDHAHGGGVHFTQEGYLQQGEFAALNISVIQ